MSLTDILKFRYPLVWVNTLESERLIVNLAQIVDDRLLYVYDDFEGLTLWDDDASDFKIVNVEVFNPMVEEKVDTAIFDFGDAFSYAFDKGEQAIFVIRNFHKDQEKYYNMLGSLYNKYYRTLRFDDMQYCPLTVLCMSTESEVPKEIAAMCAVEGFGLPTESALVEFLTYVSTKINDEEKLSSEAIGGLATACRGMAEFDVLNTVFSLIKRDGTVKSEEIERLKYERLKASSSLDIIKPKFGLDEVGGLDYAKEIVRKAQWIRDHPEQAAAKGVRPINRVLLLGVPGCGKSMICEASSKTLGLDLVLFSVARAMNKFVGQSEENMRTMLAQINALAPIALWIDELGRDFQSGNYDSGTTERVHAELLTGLQNLPSDVALFAAANDVSSLPPEMLRAERFDKILFVGYPSFGERIEIFKLNLGGHEDYDWDELATNSPFFTGAEIVQLLNEVRFAHLEREGAINTKDILSGIDRLKNRLWNTHRNAIQSMYSNALDKHEWASHEQHEEAQSILTGRAHTQNRKAGATEIRVKS